MINDGLKQRILAAAAFSPDELEMISGCFVTNRYDHKEYFLRVGNRSSSIHFIVSGLVRVYHLGDGKEITTYLTGDGGFATSFSSFITQGVSAEYVQCLDDTETLSISYEQMEWLYKRLPQWLVVGKAIAEQYYLSVADRVLKLQTTTAKERYLDFLQEYPTKVVQRTPIIYLASFLGIASESLSRIRKGIS